MTLTRQQVEALCLPFAKDDLGVKAQSYSKNRDRVMLVLYVSHTAMAERLDSVDPGWSSEITGVDWKGDTVYVRCRVTLCGVSRENYGDGDDLKGAASDAFKRAAMMFGPSRELYSSEQVWVPFNESTDRYKPWSYADYENALPKPARPKLDPKPPVRHLTNVPTPQPDAPRLPEPISQRGGSLAASIKESLGQAPAREPEQPRLPLPKAGSATDPAPSLGIVEKKEPSPAEIETLALSPGYKLPAGEYARLELKDVPHNDLNTYLLKLVSQIEAKKQLPEKLTGKTREVYWAVVAELERRAKEFMNTEDEGL